ncbi:hypothetical protein CEY12_11400 [Chryseobacterium sp. T16E-39]|uniref:SIR2 family protein n=1 Tax=Chryseobacterium sp. T16E-39 TaxID=2015076 RepID=UPI000B5B39F3|nr:SIR2 family protein [Chryseobacterium sp. T16E-39]ASK30682.1 hypothetical protein CEY12_11400 [Chryseobacterium sp. T16E-39]
MIEPKLIEAIENNELVIFVGAGCSMPLNFPSWQNLIISVLDKLNEEFSSISTLNFVNLKNQLQNNSTTLFEILEELETNKKHGDQYKARSKEIIYDLIENRIKEGQLDSEIHKLIWQLSSKIVTTNYDSVLEANMLRPNIKTFDNQNIFQILKSQNNDSEFLYKIHGDYSNPKTMTVFRSDYENIYNPKNPNEDALSTFYKGKTFLFIGFSLTDPYVNSLFDKIKKLYEGYTINKHFVFTTKDEDFTHYDIKGIKIKDWGDSLKYYIEQLIDKKKHTNTRINNEMLNLANEISLNDEDIENLPKIIKNKIEEIKKTPNDKNLQNEYDDLKSKYIRLVFGEIDYLRKIDDSYKDANLESLFDSIYASEELSIDIYERANTIRIDTTNHTWFHRSQIVSALACSLLVFKTIDKKKILLLIDFLNDNEEKVWERALTYLVVMLNHLGNKWLRFPEIIKKLELLTLNLQFQSSCQQILEYLIIFGADRFNFSERIFENTHFHKPFNYFLPFFKEDNPFFSKIYDNYEGGNIEEFIDSLSKSPLPDSAKYLICNSDFKEMDNNEISQKSKDYFRGHMLVNKGFYPYAGYIQEFVSFAKSFPTFQNKEILKTQVKLTSTSLKEYLLSEKERLRVLGIYFYKEKQWGKAILNFDKFLNLQPKDVMVLINLANCHFNEKNFKAAIEIRHEVYTIENSNLNNLIDLINLYHINEEYEKVIFFSDKYIVEDDKNSAIYRIKGWALYSLKNYNEALNMGETSLKMSTEKEQDYYLLASIYEELEEYEQSEELYLKAVELNDEDIKFREGISMMYYKSGQFKKALESIEMVLKIEKNNVHILLNKVQILLALNLLETAHVLLIKVNRSEKYKNSEVFNLFANYYRMVGEPEKAFVEIDKAEKISKESRFVGTRAVIYSSLGDEENFYHFFEEAVKLGAKAKSLFPDIKNKYENETRFKNLLKQYNQ